MVHKVKNCLTIMKSDIDHIHIPPPPCNIKACVMMERLLGQSELRGCVKVEVAILSSLSLTVLWVSVDVKQHLKKEKTEGLAFNTNTKYLHLDKIILIRNSRPGQ